MGGDHAHQRLAIQAHGQHLLPCGAGSVGPGAGIDEAPATLPLEFVFQQPHIDVIQRKRQRHARPAQARHDVVHGAGSGDSVVKRIIQLGFEGIHGNLSFSRSKDRATMWRN